MITSITYFIINGYDYCSCVVKVQPSWRYYDGCPYRTEWSFPLLGLRWTIAYRANTKPNDDVDCGDNDIAAVGDAETSATDYCAADDGDDDDDECDGTSVWRLSTSNRN